VCYAKWSEIQKIWLFGVAVQYGRFEPNSPKLKVVPRVKRLSIAGVEKRAPLFVTSISLLDGYAIYQATEDQLK
jgi:hypothetical protein